MAKLLVRQVDPHVALYRDTVTGIAWVENGHTGLGHSCHPNISDTGSVAGMKKLGHWGKYDHTMKSHGWIYNVSHLVVSDEYDELARQNCHCRGAHDDLALKPAGTTR